MFLIKPQFEFPFYGVFYSKPQKNHRVNDILQQGETIYDLSVYVNAADSFKHCFSLANEIIPLTNSNR